MALMMMTLTHETRQEYEQLSAQGCFLIDGIFPPLGSHPIVVAVSTKNHLEGTIVGQGRWMHQ